MSTAPPRPTVEAVVAHERPVRILAPATLPFEALVDTLYTAGRNDFRQYYLGVAGAGGEPALRIVFGNEKPHTVPLADRSLPTSDPARWDLAALGRVLADIEGAHPEVVHATVTAEREIPIGMVAAVFDVAAGEGCPAHTGTFEVAEDRCRFPYLIIEAGSG